MMCIPTIAPVIFAGDGLYKALGSDIAMALPLAEKGNLPILISVNFSFASASV
jgi:hypothetical protein